MLEAYTGTVLIVSHDRAFMQHAVDTMLIMDGTGSVNVRPSVYLSVAAAAKLIAV
jgi:ATPase subunit of ABC transporter with duplicated ATPase domains